VVWPGDDKAGGLVMHHRVLADAAATVGAWWDVG
jgi:hypothetical protein